MRKTKSIKIDDKEITVKELRVKDIRQIMDGGEEISWLEYLPMVCDLDPMALEEMAPSEIKAIVEAAKEVNADFLELMEKTGLMELLKSSMKAQFADMLPDSSNTGT